MNEIEIPVDPHDPVYGLGSVPDDPWFGSDEFVDGDPFDRPLVTAGLVDVPDDEDVVVDDVCHPHGIIRPNYQIRRYEIRIGSFVYTKAVTVIVSNRPRRAQ